MKLIDLDPIIKAIKINFGCSDCKSNCKKCEIGMVLEMIKKEPGIDSSVIDEVRAEMCDDYCKFSWENKASDLVEICNKCPLNRLSKYEDNKE